MSDANPKEVDLAYEEVLEYLSDRKGDECTISSFPTFRSTTFGQEEGRATMLGLRVSGHLGEIAAVPLYLSPYVEGRAAIRIPLLQEGPDGKLEEVGMDEGVVLTREWVMSAGLADWNSRLTIIVAADTDRPPLNPPVGEGQPDEARPVFGHELVGWGFCFEFDGEPPWKGRWSNPEEDES